MRGGVFLSFGESHLAYYHDFVRYSTLLYHQMSALLAKAWGKTVIGEFAASRGRDFPQSTPGLNTRLSEMTLIGRPITRVETQRVGLPAQITIGGRGVTWRCEVNSRLLPPSTPADMCLPSSGESRTRTWQMPSTSWHFARKQHRSKRVQ